VNKSDYKFVMPIATRWIDNDVYGHVNNVVYYAYFDTIINRWLIDEGGLDIHGKAPPENGDSGDVIGVCAESQCTYTSSASFPDALDGALRVAKIGTSSVTYEIAIFRGDVLCASGRFVHVFVTRDARKPTPIPARIRAALERLQ
jgi:acyl-CoA thioester hydrolase